MTDASASAGAAAVPGVAPARVCAVLTTHNRRAVTLACLGALEASALAAHTSLAAVVVDDASTDGTADAVAARFAWASVSVAGGDLYWCRGMHRAFAEALRGGHEHYLWLNDDTLLAAGAVRTLLDHAALMAARRGAPVIVVGSCVDPESGAPTYGGERMASRWRRLQVALIPPPAEPTRCDSMTGNVVLVPASVAAIVGNFDPAYEHAMGDTDYALRARRAGVEIWLAPGVVGTCRANDVRGTWADPALPLRRRLGLMLSRKGLPWRSWLHFTRRHGGALWPVRFVWPYLKLALRSPWSRRPRPAER